MCGPARAAKPKAGGKPGKGGKRDKRDKAEQEVDLRPSLTQISADFALSNKALFDQQTQKICAERSIVFNQLNALDGITAYPSAANFILFKTPKNRANEIFASIKQQGVLIKNLNAQGGLLADCLRVTIGKPEENRAFVDALTKSL
jgi:histidinol-phosphate aminotransferase